MIKLIHFIFVLSFLQIIKDEPLLKDDYCNIVDSEIVYLELMNIFSYFSDSLTNQTCPLANNQLTAQIEEFFSIQNEFNPTNAAYLKCKICGKRFKTKSLLTLHQKLFHMNNNVDKICLGDFCRTMNCDRYHFYFDIYESVDTTARKKYLGKGPIGKKEECDQNLVPFYINNCMKVAENCFGNNTQSYFLFYNTICKKINCDFGKDFSKMSLSKENGFFDILRILMMYISGILALVYVIIVVISK